MSETSPLILYVDDERPNRIVFEQSFNSQFHIKTAASAALALEILKTDSVGVIVTDQRMPEMSGQELLARVKALYPDVVRVVITAYSDLDPILRAVNDGLVAHYMIKPWDRAELEQMLAWALDSFSAAQESSALQLRLMQTERLVTVGSIGAMVAHDLQHPLASMILNVQRLEQHAESSGTLLQVIDQASDLTADEAGRLRDLASELPAIVQDFSSLTKLMDELMQSLRQFVHPERHDENRAVDPAHAIRYALSVCKETAVRAHARLLYDGPTSLPRVRIGSTELTQILINLVANAVQALARKSPLGGQVLVHATDIGTKLRFAIVDDGPGIAQSVLAKVGTPFFTTREDGTGLGVAQSKRLVSSVGGELQLESVEGAGTTATFTVPKA